jgi:3-deoxy-manno-octulosonate cytidylyltransferase (CMP-KDO synthetase)
MAKGVETVIIATDDLRIAEASFDFGAEVALTSSRHRSGTDRVAEVAGKLRGITHIINVQGDEPLIDPKVIGQLAGIMTKDDTVTMITAARLFDSRDDVHNPNMVKVVFDQAGDAIYFSRSLIPYFREDGVKPKYYRHQGIYGYTRKFLLEFVQWKPGVLERAELLEQLRALENGARIRVVLTREPAIGVDTPEDVKRVEGILGSRTSRKHVRSALATRNRSKSNTTAPK